MKVLTSGTEASEAEPFGEISLVATCWSEP